MRGFLRSLLLLYAVHAMLALWTERALWLDGAYYFTRLLENHEFVLGDGSRAGADVLVQVPVIVALKSGVTNLGALKFLFGLPPFLLAPASLLLCLWMAGPKSELIFYPLATLAAGLMNTELLVIHESRTALALFWPVLFGLKDPLQRTSTLAVSVLLSLPFIASYESAIFLGPFIVVAAFQRGREDPSPLNRRLIWGAAAAAVLATSVAALSILRPTHPTNLTSFEGSGRVLLEPGSVSAQLSICVIALLVVGRISSRRTEPWIGPIAGALALLGVLQVLSDPTHLGVTVQYRARIVNVILPLLAAPPVLFEGLRLPSETAARRALGFLFAAQIVFQLQLTWQWQVFRQVSRDRLACVRGLVPVDVALADTLEALRVSPEWMHGWHHPALSLLDHAGTIKALLGRARGYTEWQPFDPLDPRALPRLPRYGIDVSAYVSAVASLKREKGVVWADDACGAASRSGAP